MDKRRIGIGIAVVAGLVILFFVGKWFFKQKSVKQKRTQVEQARKRSEEETKEALLALHGLCRYADSVGVDTTRFGVKSVNQVTEIEAKQADLLLEIRYGKKPSRLEFSGLKEAVDSSWAKNADGASQPESLAKLAPFGPYNQLVGHYSRLRKLAKSNPAMADSLRVIRQTLNFYRYVNRFDADKFVVVNIPAGELNVFDRTGKRLLPMQVIAGKPDKRTPCMTTYIQDIVAYPYWNVPRNIALDEMLPRMKRNIAFIYNQNLQILDEKDKEVDPEEIDWDGLSTTNFPYRVRQASGCENSLGLLKFNLANPLAIYLHDTNSRDLFKLTSDRWRSHGCVRVQKPVELANLILDAQTFDKAFLDKCLIDQKPRTLPIPKPFPVFITYNIADVDATGKLRFYKDVYGLDK
ncbi:L,D-transpeptidase family protein [Spirosoma sp. KCTC 42546]|uniref:L,D-transpeptidase family protein n=1 Tax=Spirosoma sp. KCTC 42546 TaxID=2520506 RepID=UPI001159CEDE|nr:L,D-transpeptidase family protein [Spirosoma sp. KCTC 42546]QDK79267.1 L,D-transpeptidase family protein [Spirosoma sp. KCTC 42546]